MLFETMSDFHLKQLVNHITTTSGTNTCIDLIFTNCLEIYSSGPMNIHLSDHLPVQVIKKHEQVKCGVQNFKGRSYRNYNNRQHLASIEACDWTYFNQCQDPTECWDVYENMLKRMLDITCPIREFKVKDKPEPWITNYLIERISDKNNLLAEARRSTSILCWHRARGSRNIVNLGLDTARKPIIQN